MKKTSNHLPAKEQSCNQPASRRTQPGHKQPELQPTWTELLGQK